ncbi:MAG: Flp pilus assembly protein CpaB, partial [Sphingomonas sp.]|nr:Flp pilus assembly protein CpaB [Sphingomonas sp.]
MNVKKIMLLVGALVIAAVTAIMAKNMFAGAGAEQAQAASATPAVPVGPKVLVARKDLPVGMIVDAESLTFQPWPKEMVGSAYYTEGQPDSDMSKLLGTVVRYPITAGQPLTRGALVGPKDRGFLAAALGPGMSAITVPVNAVTGVAGFVFPGDRVDIMLTQ